MKRIISVFACLLLSVCALTCVGCKKDAIKLYSVYFNLNGGKWSAEYVENLNLETDSARVIKLFNSNYFEGMNNGLPTANDIIAPSGKIFAGWYLDKDLSDGKNWSYPNWKAHFDQDPSLLTLFARWLNTDKRLIVIDLLNPEIGLTEDYKSQNGITHNSPAYLVNSGEYGGVIQNLPTAQDVTVPEGKEFGGWSLSASSYIEVTEQAISDYFTQNEKVGFIKIFPYFTERFKVIVACHSNAYDENYFSVNGNWSDQAIAKYRENANYSYLENDAMVLSFAVYRDEYESIFERLPQFSDLAKYDWETEEFYEYDIVGWNVMGYDEENQTSTYTELTKELFLSQTEPASVYDTVSYISIIPIYEKV